MSKSTLDVLIEARKLIENEENWAKGAYRTCGDRFCAMGAVYYSAEHADLVSVRAALEDAMSCCVESFNDTRTHAEVMNAFDKAIETIRAQERATV